MRWTLLRVLLLACRNTQIGHSGEPLMCSYNRLITFGIVEEKKIIVKSANNAIEVSWQTRFYPCYGVTTEEKATDYPQDKAGMSQFRTTDGRSFVTTMESNGPNVESWRAPNWINRLSFGNWLSCVLRGSWFYWSFRPQFKICFIIHIHLFIHHGYITNKM